VNSDDIGSQFSAARGGVQAAVCVVVIGRNEGVRLKRCFESLEPSVSTIVYVDSGSTDGSVAFARGLGVAIVELDMQIPFTAARARNAGFEHAKALQPLAKYVQFVDGDCELEPNWIPTAVNFLETHADVAVVSGCLHERYPDASVYNMLCDIEWSAPAGEAKMCGGIAMMRVDAVQQVNGFNATLICGEEPELCSRMRARGWHIWRLGDDMGWHDANMTRFGQWWVRTVRSGYSDAQAVVIDGAPPERRGVRASRRTWFWAAGVPFVTALLAALWNPIAIWILLLYPMQIVRLALRGQRRVRENWLHSLFLVLGKFPELQGQIKYMRLRFNGQQSKLIEHK